MIHVYNFILLLIYPIYKILELFYLSRFDFFQIRRKEIRKIKDFTQLISGKVIWLHAASVGELDQCKSMIHVIKKESPGVFILQTVFSDSVQNKNLEVDFIDFYCRLPLDFAGNYDLIFKKFHPNLLIITAWDLWPNLVHTAIKRDVKVFFASATLHQGSGRIRNPIIRKLTSEVLNKVTGISPSNSKLIPIFSSLTQNQKIESAGDSRFDSVIQKIENRNTDFSTGLQKKKNSPVLILASTYNQCDTFIFPDLKKLIESGFQIWIFPHKVDEERIREIQMNLKKHDLTYSIFSENQNPDSSILVIDKIGILAYSYELADLTYVGGGFHNRIHNVIEPAYFGLPIATGPKISHAAEAIDLHNEGYLSILENPGDLIQFCSIIQDQKLYSETKEKIKLYVQKNKGASQRFYDQFLRKELK